MLPMHAAGPARPSADPSYALAPAVLPPVLVLLGLVSAALVMDVSAWGGRGSLGVVLLGVAVGLVGLAAAEAARRQSPAASRAVAFVLLAGFAALALIKLGGQAIPVPVSGDPKVVLTALAVVGLALGGLVARRRWARWLAISIAIAGAASSAITVMPGWSGLSPQTSWAQVVQAAGCCLLAFALVGPAARSDETEGDDPVWSRGDDVPERLRAAIVAVWVSVPMLLVYAVAQPGRAASLVTPAITLAAVLTIASLFTLRGKVVGALGLVVGGVGLVVLTVFSFAAASIGFETELAAYYAAFWLPGAGCAVVAGGALAGRLARGMEAESEG